MERLDPHDEDLALALASVRLPATEEDRSALTAQVCLFTDARRDAGWTAERILIAIKSHAMRAAGQARRRTPPHDWRDAQIEESYTLLLDHVIKVAIERYYEDVG